MSDPNKKCEKDILVHQLVKAQADVNIEPHVRHGMPKIYFIDTDIVPHCECEDCHKPVCETEKKPPMPGDKCCFTVTQVLCVEIPIIFDVDVDVDEGKIRCCKPDLGPCKPPCREGRSID